MITGGLENFINERPVLPDMAIIAVNVAELSNTSIQLMKYGVRKILVEKPGFNCPSELDNVYDIVKQTNSQVFLAYNRRFYSSVLEAEEILREDGGIKSFNFEFTEWIHVLEEISKSTGKVFSNLFYTNSSHVVDLAFFLGGEPVQLSSYSAGSLPLHTPAIFAGAGITDKEALFSYQANWSAPGRWSVELLTEKHRLYLKPMEALQIQKIGSLAIGPVEVDNHLDIDFKPGFYLQTKSFIEGDYTRFCTIEKQKMNIDNIYRLIAGY